MSGIRLGRSGGSAGAGYSPIGAAFDALYYRNLYADSGYPRAFSDVHTLTRASTKYAESTTGVWTEFASGVPAITDRGILIEESRTNSIRNSSTQGASPGVQPTNWVSTATANSVTRTIGSPGVAASGIEFMTYQYAGTPTASASFGIGGDSNTQIAAASGQTWTASFFVRLAAGSATNVVFNPTIRERDAGAGTLEITTGEAFTPTANWQRVSVTRTFTNALTAFVSASVGGTYTSGLAIDSTLEIGWPQLELGAFATSPIRTTSAAATRAADVITIDSKYASLAQGSAYVEWEELLGATSGQTRILYNNRVDGTTNNRVEIPSTNLPRAIISNAGTQAALAATSPIVAGATYKLAYRWGADDTAAAMSSSLLTGVVTDTLATMPTGATTLSIGGQAGGLSNISGYLRRVTFYPRKLTDAELGVLVA